MIQSIVFCIISLAIIASCFMAWFHYQKAKERERMYLLEKGESLEDILLTQAKNKIRFEFPWLKSGIICLGLSTSFLAIGILHLNTAFLEQYAEKEALELFKGFLTTFILGIGMGSSLIANHFIDKKHNG